MLDNIMMIWFNSVVFNILCNVQLVAYRLRTIATIVTRKNAVSRNSIATQEVKFMHFKCIIPILRIV